MSSSLQAPSTQKLDTGNGTEGRSNSATFYELHSALLVQYEHDLASSARVRTASQDCLEVGSQSPELSANSKQTVDAEVWTPASIEPVHQDLDFELPNLLDDHAPSKCSERNSRLSRESMCSMGSLSRESMHEERIQRVQSIVEKRAKELDAKTLMSLSASGHVNHSAFASSSAAAVKFATSSALEQIMGWAILLNTIFMGIQVQYEWSAETPLAVHVIHYFFAALFLGEVMFRTWALGLWFFFFLASEKSWNRFDACIAFTSALEAAISIILQGQDSSGVGLENVQLLRLVRAIRIMRVLRIFRALRMFKGLRILMQVVGSSLQLGISGLLLVIAAMWAFGIAISQVVAEHWSEQKLLGKPLAETDDLLVFFGSLWTSLFTLFMTVAGGIDWRDAALPLQNLDNKSGFLLYLLYVVCMTVCVMNVLTGTFCNAAMETAALDKDSIISFHMQDLQRYVERLKAVFSNMDDSGDGQCSREEFENHLGDVEVQALFRSLDIGVRDALCIFDLLDTDNSKTIDITEFVSGCISLRGNAKASQLEKLRLLGRDTQSRIRMLEQNMESLAGETHACVLRASQDQT